MAGYSSAPLPQKLGIRSGHAVAFVNAPTDFPVTLGPLPLEVRVKQVARGPLDVIVVFATQKGELRKRVDTLKDALTPNGALWLAWPKKGSNVDTTLSDDAVREVGEDADLVESKACSIDETWSALRFVRPAENR